MTTEIVVLLHFCKPTVGTILILKEYERACRGCFEVSSVLHEYQRAPTRYLGGHDALSMMKTQLWLKTHLRPLRLLYYDLFANPYPFGFLASTT